MDQTPIAYIEAARAAGQSDATIKQSLLGIGWTETQLAPYFSPVVTAQEETYPPGFNWGAFWLSWLWGIGHGYWLSLLIIPLALLLFLVQLFAGFLYSYGGFSSFVTLAWSVVFVIYLSINYLFGRRGNRWAWAHRGNRDQQAVLQREKRWTTVGWVFMVLAIFSWVSAILFLVKPHASSNSCAAGVSITINGVAQCGQATPTPTAAISETVLGNTAKADNFSISLTNVVPQPQVSGPLPAEGKEYLEIDLSATNIGTVFTNVPGSFYYQSSAGNLTPPVGTSVNGSPAKQVEISGKSALVADFLSPQQTDSSKYLLYEIPVGDNGKLVWFSKLFDTTSTRLAVFDLKK